MPRDARKVEHGARKDEHGAKKEHPEARKVPREGRKDEHGSVTGHRGARKVARGRRKEGRGAGTLGPGQGGAPRLSPPGGRARVARGGLAPLERESHSLFHFFTIIMIFLFLLVPVSCSCFFRARLSAAAGEGCCPPLQPLPLKNTGLELGWIMLSMDSTTETPKQNEPDDVLVGLLKRFDAAKLKRELLPPFEGETVPRHRVFLPSWPEHRPIVLSNDGRRTNLLARSGFESAVLFSACEGYCIPSEGRVCLEVMAERFGTRHAARQLGLLPSETPTLFVSEDSDEEEPSTEPGALRWAVPIRNAEVFASLTFSQDALLDAVCDRPRSLTGGSMRLDLTGLPESEPARLSERANEIANSIFFHLDSTRRVVLRIAPRRPRSQFISSRRAEKVRVGVGLKGLVDPDPTAFYMYGRSADGLPLVQYLAMYQVLEYYFPMYAEKVRCRKLAQFLRDPRFDAFLDRDITRAVQSVINAGSARGPSERHQLQAVLEACIDEQDMRTMLEDEQIRAAVERKGGLSRHRPNPKNEQSSLHAQVASRVYEIRCRIVHTKLADEDSDLSSALMPYSKEANEMDGDLLLIRQLAQRAITANLRPFA